MTPEQFDTIVKAKIENLPTATLKEMLIQINDDFRKGADIIFQNLLAVLIVRMPESEYVKFLDSF